MALALLWIPSSVADQIKRYWKRTWFDCRRKSDAAEDAEYRASTFRKAHINLLQNIEPRTTDVVYARSGFVSVDAADGPPGLRLQMWHTCALARFKNGAAALTLVGASVLAALLREILVGAAEATGEALGMSPAVIGIVLLASVGEAAENRSAIAMARRNDMDMSAGILLGSSIQIALFVAPVLFLLGGVFGPRPSSLSFGAREMGFLLLTVMLGDFVAADGRPSCFKWVQLLAVYGCWPRSATWSPRR